MPRLLAYNMPLAKLKMNFFQQSKAPKSTIWASPQTRTKYLLSSSSSSSFSSSFFLPPFIFFLGRNKKKHKRSQRNFSLIFGFAYQGKDIVFQIHYRVQQLKGFWHPNLKRILSQENPLLVQEPLLQQTPKIHNPVI